MLRTSRTQNVSPRIVWAGRVVFGGSSQVLTTVQPGAIRICSNGRIVSCHPGISERDAARLAAATTTTPTQLFQSFGKDAVLLPGFIDVHCHISAVGGRDWEGYHHATRAAAAGGVTTLMGMPLNSIPPTVTPQAFALEVQQANATKLAADVGLWGGVIPDSDEQELLDQCGVFGIKAFLAPLPDDAGYQAITPERLKSVATHCGAKGLPVLVHSELMTTAEVEYAAHQAYRQDHPDAPAVAHVQSRPREWERDAVAVVCDLASRCHMHVVHLSDANESLQLIQAAKQAKQRITVETCPHYLAHFLEKDSVLLKCFPPIRDEVNRTKLLQAVEKGDIDMLASDHSPCTPSMRFEPSYCNAWGGISGLQYQLHATLGILQDLNKDYDDDTTTYQQMAQLWSRSPAQLVPGMADQKGCIAPGFLADLCVIDPSHNNAHTMMKERHRWISCSPYTSMNLPGCVMGTFVSGRQVYDGETDSILVDNDNGDGQSTTAAGSLLLRPTT